MCKCMRCGYKWNAVTTSPKVCPSCKSYRWSTESQFKQAQNAHTGVVRADRQEKVSEQGEAV